MKKSIPRLVHRLVKGILVLAIAACAGTGPTGDGQPISVAVWDLEDLSPVAHGQTGIGEFLAARITAHIADMPAYQAVERQELIKAMEELNIGSSDLADAQTRLKLGRVIGAQQMVFGAFQVVGPVVRLDLRRVDVASGKVLKAGTGSASADNISGWLPAADHAAAEVMGP
jgi:curli biogenesis system outer membrane secretion channel CsgG